MAQFLSEAWFLQVHALNEQAGNLALPPALLQLIINIHIQDSQHPVFLHLKDGKIWQNEHKNAQSTIITDRETAYQLITDKDSSAALEAFMTGKIRIEGDMSALLSLQSTKPTLEQKQLFKAILAQTEFTQP